MHIKSADFRVETKTAVDLKKWPTQVRPSYKTGRQYKDLLAAHVKDLSAQQELLYASDSYALLLIFQAMDAAGKDGAIEHVMSGVNPQGCQVFSFKHPSAEELKHDFLWRTTRNLPARGQIGIFNRSYYEEVLITRVHPEILRAEGLPAELMDEKTIWIWRAISIATARRSSSFFYTSRKRSSAGASSTGSIHPGRIGSFPPRMWRSDNIGSNI
jgi:polyphosphate kinase 2 (PPK2 family)